jgi:hypothetical protein
MMSSVVGVGNLWIPLQLHANDLLTGRLLLVFRQTSPVRHVKSDKERQGYYCVLSAVYTRMARK